MNLPARSFISLPAHPGTFRRRPDRAARPAPRLSAEINSIICTRRSDETEYKLPGSGPEGGGSGGGVGRPSPRRALPRPRACRAQEAGAPAGGRRDYLWKHLEVVMPKVRAKVGPSDGWPVSGASHPAPAFVLLTRRVSFQDVRWQRPAAINSRLRALPIVRASAAWTASRCRPGCSLMGFQVSMATPCLLLSVLDAEKARSRLTPSRGGPPGGGWLLKREPWGLNTCWSPVGPTTGRQTNRPGPPLG